MIGRRGRVEFERDGRTDLVGPGDVAAVAGPGRGYSGRSDSFDLLVTNISSELLDTAVREVVGTDSRRSVRFTALTPVTEAAASRWRNLVGYLAGLWLGDEPPGRDPLVVGATARLLVHALLATFPHDLASGVGRAEDRPCADATPGSVRRAVAFIEGAVGEDIGLDDIAAAARVTPRALQYAFRRHLGTTPTAYLRRLRLASSGRI